MCKRRGIGDGDRSGGYKIYASERKHNEKKKEGGKSKEHAHFNKIRLIFR